MKTLRKITSMLLCLLLCTGLMSGYCAFASDAVTMISAVTEPLI